MLAGWLCSCHFLAGVERRQWHSEKPCQKTGMAFSRQLLDTTEWKHKHLHITVYPLETASPALKTVNIQVVLGLWPLTLETIQTKIDYLGYCISHEGIETDPEKICAVDGLHSTLGKTAELFICKLLSAIHPLIHTNCSPYHKLAKKKWVRVRVRDSPAHPATPMDNGMSNSVSET